MITEHQYIGLYPINKDSQKLIVGTIHPHDNLKFIIPYFYGNKLSIWKILNEAFPNELGSLISLEGILYFLQKNKISISDTVISCTRKTSSALDKDLIPLKLNLAMIEQIRDSKITEILFTSGFQKNSAFKLFFVDILGQKMTEEIKENRSVILEKSFFGRPIKLTILYSPSGSSNIGLSKSKMYLENQEKYKNLPYPVKAFKIDYYKEKFQQKA